MRIVRQGTKLVDRLYTAECHRCGSVIEFLKSEAKYHFDQRDGDYLSAECPSCAAKITVNA
ncbi:hypothetical protein [Sinorhizobium fredii]|uniref:hypothetical protein n=1 Tax=Rhizobium fredii TaxID=380 RepID=UPI0004B7BEF3|nr:hypothetical protein [Sinorhizobium fredii]